MQVEKRVGRDPVVRAEVSGIRFSIRCPGGWNSARGGQGWGDNDVIGAGFFVEVRSSRKLRRICLASEIVWISEQPRSQLTIIAMNSLALRIWLSRDKTSHIQSRIRP